MLSPRFAWDPQSGSFTLFSTFWKKIKSSNSNRGLNVKNRWNNILEFPLRVRFSYSSHVQGFSPAPVFPFNITSDYDLARVTTPPPLASLLLTPRKVVYFFIKHGDYDSVCFADIPLQSWYWEMGSHRRLAGYLKLLCWHTYDETIMHIKVSNINVTNASIAHTRYTFWNQHSLLFYFEMCSKCRIGRFSSNQSVCWVTQCASLITLFCENRYSALLAFLEIQVTFFR